MIDPVSEAYERFDDARPLVRPSYNEFEIRLLPPYGDPEVSIPGEIGTYLVLQAVVIGVVRRLLE